MELRTQLKMTTHGATFPAKEVSASFTTHAPSSAPVSEATAAGAAPLLTLSPTARERIQTLRRQASWHSSEESSHLKETITAPSGLYRTMTSTSIPVHERLTSTGSARTTTTGSITVLHPTCTINQQCNDTTILSGMLTKRGHFFKNWLPRYVVLSRTALTYYKKNPHAGAAKTTKEVAAIEKKYLRGTIARSDVIKVEATSAFKNRPYTFVVVAQKRSSRRFGMHSKETGLHGGCKRKRSREDAQVPLHPSNKDVVLYYLQAPNEAEKQKWMKALQRWIDGESPSKIGRKMLHYILNHEYFASRYEQKMSETAHLPLSPSAQASRKVEEDFPVLAHLIREMHECAQEDELVFILDQLLGEVKDGAVSSCIKKLIAAAGEEKLASSPDVWTPHVKVAYGHIMKALYAHTAQSSVETRATTSLTSSQKQLMPSQPSSSTIAAHRLVLAPPTRQVSDGVDHDCLFHRQYKLGRKLGSGSFSVVHIATNRTTHKQVAVKCIAKAGLSDADVLALKQEVEIMSKLDHPNLVPLLDYFDAERYYYIVTPLCTGGELFDALVKRKSYTEEDARGMMRKLASAIAYIHSKGIVHRDLKPENILLKTSAPGAEIMIADFGFARSVRGTARPGTACGTPGYVAPEVVKGEPYAAEVDCWSLGVILFILLCGYAPFPGENHAVILDKVVHADYAFESPYWDHVTESAKDLVRQLLNVDRTQRLNAMGILNHPWMHAIDEVANEQDDGDCRSDRVHSDLLPALHQLRKHSLTHAKPKILPSDMEVDVDELANLTMDGDVAMLDDELCQLDDF